MANCCRSKARIDGYGGLKLETKTGIIVSLHHDRNYGFIRGDDGEYYFFHRMGVTGMPFEDLREGHPVEFLPLKHHDGRHKGKYRAIGVVVT